MSKSRYGRDPQQRLKAPRGYNTEMIRDFLDHLTWEARIGHYEHAHPERGVNPELVEQLKVYMTKYDCCLLPIVVGHFAPGTSEEEAQRAIAEVHTQMAAEYGRYMEALEMLAPFFAKALDWISSTTTSQASKSA